MGCLCLLPVSQWGGPTHPLLTSLGPSLDRARSMAHLDLDLFERLALLESWILPILTFPAFRDCCNWSLVFRRAVRG